MDDLKLITKNRGRTPKTETSVMISIWNLDLTRMQGGILKRRKLVQSQNLMLDLNREIQELEQAKKCRYLGTE